MTYSASRLPPGLSINSSNGLITGTLSTPATPGWLLYSIGVTVSDNLGHSLSNTFFWAVTDGNSSGGGSGAGGTTTVENDCFAVIASWAGRFGNGVARGVVEVPFVVCDLGQAGYGGVYMGVTGDPFQPHWLSMTGQGANRAFDLDPINGVGQVEVTYLWNVGSLGILPIWNAAVSLVHGDPGPAGQLFGGVVFTLGFTAVICPAPTVLPATPVTDLPPLMEPPGGATLQPPATPNVPGLPPGPGTAALPPPSLPPAWTNGP